MGLSRRIFLLSVLVSLVIHTAGTLAAQSVPKDKTSDLYAIGDSTNRGSFRSSLSPVLDIPLSSHAAGIIEAIHILEGSPVKAGQAIISLDSIQERAEVAQAEAAVRGSKADMDRAESDFNRIQQITAEKSDKIYSDKQIEEAKAQAAIARSRFDQAIGALDSARGRLANRDIVSPIDGIFIKSNKVVGEAVERYEPVAQVVDISSLKMIVFCDGRDFSLFKVGQKVDVRVIKSPKDQPIITGSVFHVDPIIDSSGTFRVKASNLPWRSSP